jgi:hypothetical protein
MKTIVYSVVVHSCLLRRNLVSADHLDPNDQYVAMDDKEEWYCALMRKCSCRKLVTYDVADDLVKNGSAELVWKIRKTKIEKINTSIWMAQQVKVPRIDLSTEEDIERAFINGNEEYVDYIDAIHQMYMENRQKLIVPFREELLGEWPKPCRDGQNPGEILPGRLLFPFPADDRTQGGHK